MSSLASPLEYFIDRVKLEKLISSPTLSIHEFCCAHTNKRIFYWGDDVHMLYKGVFIRARINWVKWTHGHYLVVFLPLLLSSIECCLLLYVFLILQDSNSRTNYFQEEGNDSIQFSPLALKLIGFNVNQENTYHRRKTQERAQELWRSMGKVLYIFHDSSPCPNGRRLGHMSFV